MKEKLLEKVQNFKEGFRITKTEFEPIKSNITDFMGMVHLYVDRKFNYLPFDLMDKQNFYENAEPIIPSDKYFESKIKDLETKNEDEIEQEVDRLKDEWRNSCFEIHTPLYTFADKLTENFLTSSEDCNIDVLATFGFCILEYNDRKIINMPSSEGGMLIERFGNLFTFLGWMTPKKKK